MAAVIDIPGTDNLNDAELVFLEGVFAYQGIHGHPTEDEFRQGLAVLSAYAMQVQDNPPAEVPGSGSIIEMYRLTDNERLKMTAIAFMRFGVTKPSSWQWQAAYEHLFSPAFRPGAACH